MQSPEPPRPPDGAQDTRVLLEALAGVFGSGTLKESMTVGAGLLAHVLSSEQAAVFLADGEEPLREYWHSKVPEVRERIRATFKATALEAVRAGLVVTPAPVVVGERLIQPCAHPLRTGGRVLGAVCFSDPGEQGQKGVDRDRLIEAVTSVLAHKAASHEEAVRYRAQRERDQSWFKTLDNHLRVLDRERQKFAAFVNQTDTFVYVTDGAKIIRWNNRAMTVLYPPDGAGSSWVGKSCSDVCSRLREKCEDCPVSAALEHAQVIHHELRANVRGTEGLLYLTALPILGPSGGADEIMVMIQDLTGLAGLRKSEERLRTVISGAPIVLFAIDPQGIITFSEGRGLSALGRKSGESVGKSIYAVYADYPDLAQNVRRALGGEEFSAEIEIGEVAFEARYAPIRDGRGDVQGVIGVATDISDRRRAQRALLESEAALRRSEEQLRHAQKMEAIGVLAGGVAHDFNNLLSVIMAQAGLLVKDADPRSPAARIGAEIHAASKRGVFLTRQLLTFSRNEVVSPEVIDLNTVVAELEGMFRGFLRDDIDLVCARAPESALVRADRGQIEQVMLNLVANSRDAMPNGGSLRISVAHVAVGGSMARELGTAAPGPFCALTVQDTGLGMDSDTKGRIFEPFFTTKERGKGTGLGLSTAYGIVKQGGGSITVSSEARKGATFTVYIPSLDGSTASSGAVAPGLGGGAETILLVEDEAGVRSVAREVLEMEGYNVLEAEDGVKGLQLAMTHQGPIHLLLSDVVMPGMSGRDLAERLGVERPGIRVLFISGYTDDTMVRRGVRDAKVAFLQKPFTLENLAKKVREVLDGPGVGAAPVPDGS
ncbi:MAG: response regulator [Candidatus Eisenbacteria bacterium]|uniref:histidine kinase n=1 Tax=Eiseniibacteriota bacterium TaxID=2212470 RepID=A0A538TRP1_UNCEI|nr:MAG: response regulator [Candidatus Eisenbacteria bacterium]